MVTGIHQDQKIKTESERRRINKEVFLYNYTIGQPGNPRYKNKILGPHRYNENHFTFDDDIIKSTSEQNNFSTTFWKLSFPTIKKPCTLMVQGLNVTFNWNKLVSRSLTV